MEGWVDLGDRLHTEMVYTPTDYEYITNCQIYWKKPEVKLRKIDT